MSRKTQKVEIYLADEASGLANFDTNLGHAFESKVGNDFGVRFRRKDFKNQSLFTTMSA